jgi:hypothetical protein
MGRESLPTGLDSFRIHGKPRPGEPVRCEARCTARSQHATRWSLRYLTTDGQLICTLEGAQLHLLPASKTETLEPAVAGMNRS